MPPRQALLGQCRPAGPRPALRSPCWPLTPGDPCAPWPLRPCGPGMVEPRPAVPAARSLGPGTVDAAPCDPCWPKGPWMPCGPAARAVRPLALAALAVQVARRPACRSRRSGGPCSPTAIVSTSSGDNTTMASAVSAAMTTDNQLQSQQGSSRRPRIINECAAPYSRLEAAERHDLGLVKSAKA